MIDVSFEINVRKVNSNNVKDVLESEILSQVAESIKKSVGNLRCAEHGHLPKIKVKGRNFKKFSFEISGCCDTLIEKVSAKLK